MFNALKGRIALYALNVTGFFLVIRQTPDDPDTSRRILGFILIGLGTLGILAINFWPRREEGEASSDDDDRQDTQK